MLGDKPLYLLSYELKSYQLSCILAVKIFAFFELEKIFYFSFEHYYSSHKSALVLFQVFVDSTLSYFFLERFKNL